MLIRVSIGTAAVLGLARLPMGTPPTTAYLMLGGRCAMNCAFCAQARTSQASDLALSRITWPEYALTKVCEKLREAEGRGAIRRCCIQVTASQDYVDRALLAVAHIRAAVHMPLDVSILPANQRQVEHFISMGVDHVGFGLDAACERVFRQVKGPHWSRVVGLLEQTARRHPGRAAVHLIVGLGETEQELLARVVWARDLGIEVGLFAFTPLRGTQLGDQPPPPIDQYRRVQAATRLLLSYDADLGDLTFSPEGVLTAIRVPGWVDRLADGEAFRTLGCPDCNRPYYNERPGGTMYNYPCPLTPEEAAQAITQTGLVAS